MLQLQHTVFILTDILSSDKYRRLTKITWEGMEMTKAKIFNKDQEKIIKTLRQYVPVVDRVHGDTHPEFHEVRRLFESIDEKSKTSVSEAPVLNDEFAKLRQVTKNYTIPNDVCESYEAVYVMLAELDEAYNEINKE
jgi:regulator of cell morphogenesis and NO signaling